jgi:hypothetical protein
MAGDELLEIHEVVESMFLPDFSPEDAESVDPE